MRTKKALVMLLAMSTLFCNAFALTSGPSQPEFASFEAADATDLVNLPTGDFTYVLPLGKVNTPDGTGYPIVLSYHSGILNDQEASWVGLGWSLNVGSINRSVRQLPDDYNSNGIYSLMYMPGERGWGFSVGVGWGPVSASVGFSGKANGGVTFEGFQSLSLGFPAGPLSIGLSVSQQGMSYGANMHFGSASVGMGMSSTWGGQTSGLLNAGLSSGGYSMAGFSMSSSGGVGISVAGQSMPMSQSMSKDGFHQSSESMSFSLPFPGGFTLDLGFVEWSWYYRLEKTDPSNGYLFLNKKTRKQVNGGSSLINWVMKNNSSGYKYGEAASAPVLGYEYPENEKNESSRIGKYVVPSQDAYSLSGQGISCTFMPMLSTPTVSSFSDKEELNGILGSKTGIHTVERDYDAVLPGNLYNAADVTISNSLNDGMVFKSLDELSSNLIDNFSGYKGAYSYSGYNNFANIGSANAATKKVEMPWVGKRIIPLIGLNGIAGLNGFAVIDAEGKTYYYTKALYSLYQTTYTSAVQDFPALKAGSGDEFEGSVNFRRLTHPYATSWLLTAVTGPDYVKMIDNSSFPLSEKLLPHNGDYGYWVRFNYAYGPAVAEDQKTKMPRTLLTNKLNEDGSIMMPRYIDKAVYGWRLPYFDSESSRHPHQVDLYALNSTETGRMPFSSMFGMKEMTYLKSIETASEVAFFRTSERFDGYGLDYDDFKPLGAENLQYGASIYNREQNCGTDNSKGGFILRPFHTAGSPHIIPVESEFGSSCGFIKLSSGEFPLARYSDAKRGDVICRLECSYYKEVHRGWDGIASFLQKSPEETVVFDVVKDSLGCELLHSGDDTYFTKPLGQHRDDDLQSPSSEYRGQGPFIKAVKCFYAETRGDNVYLYFIPFKGRTWKDANQVQRFAEEGLETGVEVQPSEMATFYTLYGTPTISVAQNTGNTIFFTARDNYCRWTKKLDEIAWYSKADYPFINGDWDPQEPFIRDNPFWKKNSTSYTFPASYRRMKFGYNYELAKGTPNSRSNGYEIGSLGYPIKRPNSGRLSLKEIHEQAGQEAAGKSVDMPSYLFAYQDKDSLYGKNLNDQDTAFRRVDVWGYRTEDRLALHSNSTYDDQSKVGTKGVHWNLSSITLPSCGTINVSYERDRARSSWLTLAEMNREYEAIKKAEDRDKIKEGLYYPALKAFGADNSNYTTDVEVNNLFPNTPVITSVAGSSCEGLEPGMLAILVYEGSKTTGSTIRNMTQATYLYRICKINYSHASAEITLDKPLEPPPTELTGTGATYSIKLRGIKKKSDICDGIRVTKIQTNSISGVTTTAYRYPIDGVIESAPADAIPPFLTQNWNKLFTYTETSSFTGVASAAVFMYSPASNIPMPKITLRTGFYPKGPAEAEIYHSAMNAYIFGETQNFNIAGQEVRFIIPRSQTSDFGCELHILYSYEGDDITGPAKRDISVAGKFNGAELVKTYSNVEFPITPGFAKAQFVGDVVIPISEKFMTSNLNIGRDYWHNVSIKFSANSTGDLKIYGILKRVVSSNKKAIAYAPIFTSGNTGVIYPVVEVQQTKPDGTLFTGKTRYSYFTIDDTVPANGTSVPIVSSSIIKTSEGVPVWRVFDRTGIVGLAKTIEQVQVNNAGTETVVGKTEKQYAFSEDMYKSDVGVLSAADTRLDNTKPIGLIRERAIGIELKNTDDAKNLTKPPSAISDIVRSKPFLVSIQEQTDRASKGTKFGLFDALTGNALATLVTGASPTGTVTRLNVTVPYRFILSKYVSSQKELLDTMMNKNILTLPGGNYVSDNNALTTMPDNIAASASDEAQHIKSADFTQYLLRPYKGSNIPFAQARIEQQSKYSWKMNPTVGGFGWLLNSDSTIKGCWIANSYIDSIDLYSRPLQERTPGNAPGVFQVSTAINHPTAPAVLAVVANAAYDECAVFTCDYDQNIGNTPVGSNTFVRTCFDDVNGWMANQNSGELKVIPLSRTGTPNRHFGNKALHFSNGAAVSKTLDRNAGYTKDFMVSAWVYPEDTDNEFKVTFSLSAKTGSTNSASPVTFSRKITDLKKDVWQQVRFFICREELAFSAPLSLQISVSASIGSFYMDDIRFHPANALMSTFYYDYSFNKPVAMVDANSHAQYFRYDEFGRLVEKGVIKDRKPNGKQSIAATVTAVQDVNNPKTWVLTAAVSQGSMQSVVWDFGDGSRKLSSDLEVNKTYVATGTGTHAYSVTVYVIGQDAVATAKTNVSFTIP